MPEDLAERREATKRISFRFPQTLAAMKDRQKLEQYRGQLKGTAPEQAKITEYLSNTVSVDLEIANSPFLGEGKERNTGNKVAGVPSRYPILRTGKGFGYTSRLVRSLLLVDLLHFKKGV